MVSGSLSLPARGASHLSLTVLVHYRSLACIQPFGMVPDNSPGISRAPGYSGAGLASRRVSRKGLSPAAARLSRRFRYAPLRPRRRSYYPARASTRAVWASPRSLAATGGIIVIFFSCGYLDVSVPRVRLRYAHAGTQSRRVPPFGHPRVDGHLPLTAAFRSLSRPSSPSRAKASPMCPSSLSFYLSLSRGARSPEGPTRRARSHSSVSIMSMCYLSSPRQI